MTKGKANFYLKIASGFLLAFIFIFSFTACAGTEELHIHSYVVIPAEAATCTQTGLSAGVYCETCGEVILEQEVTPMLQHELVEDGAVEPTLTHTGLTAGLHCAVCGEVFVEQKVIEKLPCYEEEQVEIKLDGFASVTDDDGRVDFFWNGAGDIDHIDISVTAEDGTQNFSMEGEKQSWGFDLNAGIYYEFNFAPVTADGASGEIQYCTRYYNPEIKNLNFPTVEITTQNYVWPSCDYVTHPEGAVGEGITNNDYEQCIVSISDGNRQVYTSSAKEDYQQAKIKVRGNTSAYYEKKPYKIKLNKKADLLAPFIPDRGGEFADKEWLLLRAGTDFNPVFGREVSELLQMDYTSAYTYVALFVNGDYRGLYILCESVKQGNVSGENQSRCKVDDDGFIVELDAYWWNEDLYFTTPLSGNTSSRYTFKYPDSDDIDENSEEYNYIKNYITEFENALTDSESDSYLQYIDEESFAKWLVGQDILASCDPAGTNIYLLKKNSSPDSPLVMGLMWDFDGAGDRNFVNQFALIHSSYHFYFPYLTQRESFMESYRSLFSNVKDSVLDSVTAKIEELGTDSFKSLIDFEKERWNDSEIASYEEQKSTILIWIEQHISWLEGEIYGTN